MGSASGAAREHSAEYIAYLASDTWWRFRVLYWQKHDRRCPACGAQSGIDLHHVTYERLGHERNDDVVPLCRSCHDAVHLAHRQGGGLLAAATWRYITGRGRREGRRRVVPSWAVSGGVPDQRQLAREARERKARKRAERGQPGPETLTRRDRARAARDEANLTLKRQQDELRALRKIAAKQQGEPRA